MKKILIISNSFPPDLDGGVFRPLKFTKYLPKFGWTPVILKSKTKLLKNYPKDDALCRDFPPDLMIYETYSLAKIIHMFQAKLNNKLNSLELPDVHIGWLPFAILAGKKAIMKDECDVIFTTGPPHSTHLIGFFLKKLHRKPWVADLRDPWTLNFLHTEYPFRFQKQINEWLEKLVITNADQIITVTDPINEDFISKYNYLNSNKFICIPNGYDPDDFKYIIPQKTNKFTITYTGSFYGSLSPEPFFQCLKEVLEEHHDMREKMTFVIAGQSHEELIKEMINKFGLKDIVDFKGVVSYKESLRLMVNSDVLLLILPSDENNDHIKNVYTQKIFNYLATGKPILGLVPEGIASELIRNFGDSIVVHPDIFREIKNAIYELYSKYSEGIIKGENGDLIIERYNRQTLTDHLAATLNSLTTDK
jgi:glycosyltransferase involved in cell wall biosynthesis